MTLTNAYVTLPEFKGAVGKQNVTDDASVERAIEAASRAIDTITGRRFYTDSSATAREYRATDPYWLEVDDFHTTTGLIVKTDTGDDGTFETTWASTDYELEPVNGIVSGIEGWPYSRIHAVEGYTFPTCNRRRSVQITAKWGWAATPTAIKQACMLVANDYWKSKDAPFGVAGIDTTGIVARVRNNPMIMTLLVPYTKSGTVRAA